jgi:hypothetical protein
MPVLAISGVELPVAVDSFTRSHEMVGTKRRNARGHTVLERRREKTVIEFETSPVSFEEAMLYRSLILGEGEFWNTLASTPGGQYGSKGLALTGTGAWSGSGGGNPNNGNGTFLLTTGQTMVVPGYFYDQSAVSTAAAAITGATLIGWRYDGAAYRLAGFSWRVLDATVATKREKLGSLGSSGVAQAYTGTETLSVSGGNLTLTAPGAGGPWRWSNITVYPWFCDSTLVDLLLDGKANALYTAPPLPRLYVTGDAVLPTDQQSNAGGLYQASLICTGDVEELVAVSEARGGTFRHTDMRLRGSLTEV